MTTGEDTAGAKQLRTVAKLWYRADHAAANAGCALLAGYPAGLLKACGVSAGAIGGGTASGGELVVAWANQAWTYEAGSHRHSMIRLRHFLRGRLACWPTTTPALRWQ